MVARKRGTGTRTNAGANGAPFYLRNGKRSFAATGTVLSRTLLARRATERARKIPILSHRIVAPAAAVGAMVIDVTRSLPHSFETQAIKCETDEEKMRMLRPLASGCGDSSVVPLRRTDSHDSLSLDSRAVVRCVVGGFAPSTSANPEQPP